MKPERKSSLWYWFGAVDNNDLFGVTLIWDTEESERKIRHSSPDDDRIYTLITLLKALADPIEREIPHYAP